MRCGNLLKECNQSALGRVVFGMVKKISAQSSATLDRLILVYNADSGIINALMHGVHKQLFPETYPCSLCAITYGAVSMHGEWRAFLGSLPMDVIIHHKDDFEAAFPGHGFALPAVLIADSDGAPQTLIPAKELDAIQDTVELIDRVEERLANEEFRRFSSSVEV